MDEAVESPLGGRGVPTTSAAGDHVRDVVYEVRVAVCKRSRGAIAEANPPWLVWTRGSGARFSEEAVVGRAGLDVPTWTTGDADEGGGPALVRATPSYRLPPSQGPLTRMALASRSVMVPRS